MSTVQVFLLGKFCVRCNGQALPGLETRKAGELFSYLLLYQDRPHSREALADLLWGGNSTAQSKKYLRQVLWQLQSTLSSRLDLAGNCPLLVEPDWVQINPQAGVWVDAATFEQAFTLTQGMPGEELVPSQVQALERAIDLYQGDLLEGWYQDWCLYERERLQNMYLAMLDKLMAYCQAHGHYEMGMTYGTRILRYDRAREHTHRQLMRLHYLAGKRTAALRQYEQCVAALDKELGVKPSKRTTSLHKQIQADRLDAPNVLPVETVRTPGIKADSLSEVLDRLRQFQAILSDVQYQVEQDIRVVEQVLSSQH
jgi:DNA-binding SARP family transcriptional activator